MLIKRTSLNIFNLLYRKIYTLKVAEEYPPIQLLSWLSHCWCTWCML